MDLEKIEDIIRILDDSGAREILITKGEDRVEVKKARREDLEPVKSAPAPETAPEDKEATPAEDKSIHTIYSNIVGRFIEPEEPVGPGTKLKVGTLLGTIEAMRLRNDVVSDCEGTIVEKLVHDGQALEYKQPMFKIKLAN